MLTTLVRCESRTNSDMPLGYDCKRVGQCDAGNSAAPPGVNELEELAGDFILRHVLERDSVLFEG